MHWNCFGKLCFLVYMYYTHPSYQTSIVGKNCAYYIRIFMVLDILSTDTTCECCCSWTLIHATVSLSAELVRCRFSWQNGITGRALSTSVISVNFASVTASAHPQDPQHGVVIKDGSTLGHGAIAPEHRPRPPNMTWNTVWRTRGIGI